MRLQTDGLIRVTKTLEDQYVHACITPKTDAAAYGDGELVEAVACLLDVLRPGHAANQQSPAWLVEIRKPENTEPREQLLAVAAALLIREIDRCRHVSTELIEPFFRSK